MTGRHLLTVGLLAVATVASGAGTAFAGVIPGEFTYSTKINGLTSKVIDAPSNNQENVTLTSVTNLTTLAPTSMSLFKIANTTTAPIGTGASSLPSNTSLDISISITDDLNNQTVTRTFAVDGGGAAVLNGAVGPISGNSTVTKLPTIPLVFSFTDGNVFTIASYTYTSFGAPGVDGQLNGLLQYTAAAPEPGSLSLAATGLLSALGVFGLRRRRRGGRA